MTDLPEDTQRMIEWIRNYYSELDNEEYSDVVPIGIATKLLFKVIQTVEAGGMLILRKPNGDYVEVDVKSRTLGD